MNVAVLLLRLNTPQKRTLMTIPMTNGDWIRCLCLEQYLVDLTWRFEPTVNTVQPSCQWNNDLETIILKWYTNVFLNLRSDLPTGIHVKDKYIDSKWRLTYWAILTQLLTIRALRSEIGSSRSSWSLLSRWERYLLVETEELIYIHCGQPKKRRGES